MNKSQLEEEIHKLAEEIEAKRSKIRDLRSELEKLAIQSTTETFGGDVQKGTILYTQTKDEDVYVIVDSYVKGGENIYGIAVYICDDQIFFDSNYALNVKEACVEGAKYTQVRNSKLFDAISKFSINLTERIKVLEDWY